MELILECIGGLAIITGVVFAIAWACFFVESVRELQREMECQRRSQVRDQKSRGPVAP